MTNKKMGNILFISLLVFILFSIPGFSQELYQYGVTAEIFENNTVHYRLNLIFASHPAQSFTIPLDSPYNINLNSTADCKVLAGMLETNVVCIMNASERTDIIINYDSNQNVNKKDSYFLFSNSFKLTLDTNIISVLIKLPEGTGLKKPIENSYNPEDALIGSDGRRTIITWQKNNLKSGEIFEVSVAFERIGEIITSEFPVEIIIGIVIVLISAFLIFYKFYWKTKGIRLILPVLKKDEKKIFDTIIKHGSGINQKVIVRDSGYSKAKVSKVLNSLRERGLIKLERIGRSNKVYIEKNLGKKS
jgi:uncharacterized membrane protein